MVERKDGANLPEGADGPLGAELDAGGISEVKNPVKGGEMM